MSLTKGSFGVANRMNGARKNTRKDLFFLIGEWSDGYFNKGKAIVEVSSEGSSSFYSSYCSKNIYEGIFEKGRIIDGIIISYDRNGNITHTYQYKDGKAQTSDS